MIFFKLAFDVFKKNVMFYLSIIFILVTVITFTNSFFSHYNSLTAEDKIAKGFPDTLIKVNNMNFDMEQGESEDWEVPEKYKPYIKGVYKPYRTNFMYQAKNIMVSSYNINMLGYINLKVIEGQSFKEYNGTEYPIWMPKNSSIPLGTIVEDGDTKYKVAGYLPNKQVIIDDTKMSTDLTIQNMLDFKNTSTFNVMLDAITLDSYNGIELSNSSKMSFFVDFIENIDPNVRQNIVDEIKSNYTVNDLGLMKIKSKKFIKEELLKFSPILLLLCLISVLSICLMSYFFIKDSLYLISLMKTLGGKNRTALALSISFMAIISIISTILGLLLIKLPINPLTRYGDIQIGIANIFLTFGVILIYWGISAIAYSKIIKKYSISQILKELN